MYYPKYVKYTCKNCVDKHLEVWAFDLGHEDYIPMLVCTQCGRIYELSEYKVTPKKIQISAAEYETEIAQGDTRKHDR